VGFLFSFSWSDSTRAEPANPPNPARPFGFLLDVPSAELSADLDEVARLGAGWVRLSGQCGLDWQQVEPVPGRLDWRRTDQCVKAAAQRGLSVMVTVQAANRGYGARRGYVPRNLRALSDFLANAAERYDGDGVADAPGGLIVSVWQIETEVDYPANWPDSPGNYATLFETSYKAIKAGNPNARVAVAGMMSPAGLDKYAKIMNYLDRGLGCDIFDLHWNNTGGGDYRLQRTWRAGHVTLDNYVAEAVGLLGPPRDRTAELWITETSTSDSANPDDNQRTQAAEILKRFVYALRRGASAVAWTGVRDRAGTRQPADYFNRSGLIDAAGQKKLAYYSFALMTEKLSGCDATNLEVVAETANARVYRFDRTTGRENRPIWVLWNDGLSAETFSLRLGSTGPVRITEAVPQAGLRRGAEIRNPSNVFNVKNLQGTPGTLRVNLPPGMPVYVE